MLMRQFITFTILFGFFIFLIIACGQKAKEQKEQEAIIRSTKKLVILSTTTIVNDLVAQIGGERVITTSLMGVGIDPHAYRAKEADARLLYNAEVIFYNGLHLEAKLATILEKLSEEKKVFALANGLNKNKLIEVEDGIYDPHFWFAVDLWEAAARYVYEKLAEIDPQYKLYYKQQYENYRLQLKDLDKKIRQAVQGIPTNRRILITGHDAFAYFGKYYNVEVLGLQGINTLARASAGDINNLANFIIEKNIPAIFIETSISKKNIIAVQSAVFANGSSLIIGGELYTDALGNKKEQADTYISMFEKNIQQIVYGLNQ